MEENELAEMARLPEVARVCAALTAWEAAEATLERELMAAGAPPSPRRAYALCAGAVEGRLGFELAERGLRRAMRAHQREQADGRRP